MIIQGPPGPIGPTGPPGILGEKGKMVYTHYFDLCVHIILHPCKHSLHTSMAIYTNSNIIVGCRESQEWMEWLDQKETGETMEVRACL